MMSQITFQQFSRSELKSNSELIKKFSSIVRQEELESDHPLPVQGDEFYQARYNLDPFPFDEQTYILIENEDKRIGYGARSIRATDKTTLIDTICDS